MTTPTLAFRNLPPEHVSLVAGGLYWLGIEHASDVLRVAAQCLDFLGRDQQTSLIATSVDIDALLEQLDPAQGPASVRLLEIKSNKVRESAHHLVDELKRGSHPRNSLILLLLPATAMPPLSSRQYTRWLKELGQWLSAHQCTLLILQHGLDCILEHAALRTPGDLAGLALLGRQQGGISYQVQFWRDQQGLNPARSYQLEWRDNIFVGQAAEVFDSTLLQAVDRHLHLVLRSALQDISILSSDWRLFDSTACLLQEAVTARAATIILGITRNHQLGELADTVSQLRNNSGGALKIVVREQEACLRHHDQQLLLMSGANLIIPARTPRENLFPLINSIQGQLWYRPPHTLENLLAQQPRFQLCGLQDALTFLETVTQVYDNNAGAVPHQLLELHIDANLTPAQLFSQLDFRRHGDIATLVDGRLYLFLFACGPNALGAALGNICKLPWTILFTDYRLLDSPSQLPRERFSSASLPETLQFPATTSSSTSPSSRPPPRRVTLTIIESNDDVFRTA